MKKKILIVDDQEGIRFLLSEVLKSEGIEVVDVSSGERAIQICASLKPNLIMLDMKMPGLNGVDTLRIIRKDLGLTVPVMMMTAYSELSMSEEAERLGIDKLILKPFDIYTLIQDILQLVCKTPAFVDNRTKGVIENDIFY